MRVERCRKKKLIVAFHFQVGNQAAWKCDVCRRNGLEQKRNCGWQKDGAKSPHPIVWARERAALTTCPKSYITPESLVLLEEFHVWKIMGLTNFHRLPARLVDAILVLETELALERKNAQV